MSELKPCPACGSRDVHLLLGDDEVYSVDCGNCAMRVPAEHFPDFAGAAWNSLPRALTWTTEPPTVVGKFWWRDGRHPHEVGILTVTQTKLEGFKHRRPGPHEQFSGPIPEPKEPT